ncbi:MAG TPA: hypothetical protein VLQ91_08955 [Draconibacterium sp.]|nr:hypothetical protein [Draconibacterium sp.]
MKKFTFIIAFIFIAVAASTQIKIDKQIKFKQAQEKFLKISQRSADLANYSKKLVNQESQLKSDIIKDKLDSTVYQIFDAEMQLWQNDYKDEFAYDVLFRNTSWLEKEWDPTTQTWNDWYKTDLGYDDQKRVNSMLTYNRDALTLALTLRGKFLIYYNSQGMQDSTLTYYSENEGVSWILEIKQINYYNSSNQLIKSEMWFIDEDSGVLTLSMNSVYTYTASEKTKTTITNYIMDGDEIPWSKIDYTYDESDRLTSMIDYTFDYMTISFKYSSRDTLIYNTSGKVSVEINSDWNGTSWVDKYKYDTQYNVLGDVFDEIYSVWNGTTWIQEEKDEYMYSSTNFSDVVYPYFIYFDGFYDTEEFTSKKAISVINTFKMKSGSWKDTEKTTFYYSGRTSTNINEIENTVVSVYPNPASESVKFSWKGNNDALSLEIYQITGTKVIDQIVYSNRAVSIAHL